MLLTNLNRIVKYGFKNFWRNGWLNVATVSVIILALFMMSILVMINQLTDKILADIQEKMDISVYFKPEVVEFDIQRIKSELENLSQVKFVEYVSKEKAWEEFQSEHKENPTISESIAEIETNPLYATLNIKAHQPEDYPGVVNFLEQDNYRVLTSKINYKENKEQINKLSDISRTVRQAGIFLTLIFCLIAIIITFNAIRLTMHSHHREIEIMRLVGANNWYIRWPFIIEGMLFGIVGGIICFLLFYFGIILASPKISNVVSEINMIEFFKSNALKIIVLQISAGIFLGIISSLIAIRKYLKI